MSNWSVVSISFSGLEFVTPDAILPAEGPWIVTPACEHPDAPGSAVEWWMTTHYNHFSIDEMREELRKIRWWYPCQVCIIWKNEHMDVPRIEMAFPELIGEVENAEQVKVTDPELSHRSMGLRHP